MAELADSIEDEVRNRTGQAIGIAV